MASAFIVKRAVKVIMLVVLLTNIVVYSINIHVETLIV